MQDLVTFGHFWEKRRIPGRVAAGSDGSDGSKNITLSSSFLTFSESGLNNGHFCQNLAEFEIFTHFIDLFSPSQTLLDSVDTPVDMPESRPEVVPEWHVNGG